MSRQHVYLTDGVRFIGPYEPGDWGIKHGEQELRAHGADSVYRVHALTLEEARELWAATESAGMTGHPVSLEPTEKVTVRWQTVTTAQYVATVSAQDLADLCGVPVQDLGRLLVDEPGELDLEDRLSEWEESGHEDMYDVQRQEIQVEPTGGAQ